MSTLPISRGTMAKDQQPFRGDFQSNNMRHLIKTQEASIKKYNRKPQVFLNRGNADLKSAITPPSAGSPILGEDTLQISREKVDDTQDFMGKSQNNETNPTVTDLPHIGLVRVESRENASSQNDKSPKKQSPLPQWTPSSSFHVSNSRWMPFPIRKTGDKAQIIRRGVTPQTLNKNQMLQIKQNFTKLYQEATQNYAHSKTPLPRAEAEKIASNMSLQLNIGKAQQFSRRRNFQDRRATLDPTADPMKKKNQGSSTQSYFAISSAREDSKMSSSYQPLNQSKMKMHSTLRPQAFDQLMADLQVKTKIHVMEKDVERSTLQRIYPQQVNKSQLSSTNEANFDAEIGSEATPGLNARLMHSQMKDYDLTPNQPPSQAQTFGSQVQDIMRYRQNLKFNKQSSQQQSRTYRLEKIRHHRNIPSLTKAKELDIEQFSFKPKIIQRNPPYMNQLDNKETQMDNDPILVQKQVKSKELQTQQTSPRNFQYSPKTSDTHSALSNNLSPTNKAIHASKSLSQNKGGKAGFSNVVKQFFLNEVKQDHIKIQNHQLQISPASQNTDYHQLRQHQSRGCNKGGGYRVSQNQLSFVKETTTKTNESLLEGFESTDHGHDGKTKVLSDHSTSIKSQNDVLTLLPEAQAEQVNAVCTEADSMPVSPAFLQARINQNSQGSKEMIKDKQFQMKIISPDSTKKQLLERRLNSIEYQCMTNKSRLPYMCDETNQPLPYAKTKAIKGRSQNAAFAWKYQNVKKTGSQERQNKGFDRIQDEMQESMRKTFQIFEKGVRHASVDPSINILETELTNRSQSITPRQKFDYQSQLKIKEYKVPLGDLPQDQKYIDALNSLRNNFSLAQIAQFSMILSQIEQLELNEVNKQAIIKEIVQNTDDYTQDSPSFAKELSKPVIKKKLFDTKVEAEDKRDLLKLKTGPLSLEKSPAGSLQQFQTFHETETKILNEFNSKMNVLDNNNFDAQTREGNSNIQSQNLQVIRAMDSLRRIAEKSMDEKNIEVEVPLAETEAKVNDSVNSDTQKVKIDLKPKTDKQKPFMITAISSTGRIDDSTKQKLNANLTDMRSSLHEIASNQKLQEFARIFQSGKLNSNSQIKDILQNMVVDRNAEILRQHNESIRAGKTYTAKRQLENSWTTKSRSQRRSIETQINQFSLKQNGDGNEYSTMNFEEHQLISSGYDSPARNSIMEIEKPGIRVASQDLTNHEPLPTEKSQEESQEVSFSKPRQNEPNPFSNQRLQESANEQEGRRLAMLQSLVLNLNKTPKLLEMRSVKPRDAGKVPEVQTQRNLSNYGRQREAKPGMPNLAVESQSIAILDRSQFSLKQGTVDSLLQSSMTINQQIQNLAGNQNMKKVSFLDPMNQNSATSGKFFQIQPGQKLSSTLYQPNTSRQSPPDSPQHFLKTLIQDDMGDNEGSLINSSVNITDVSQHKMVVQQTKPDPMRDLNTQDASRNQTQEFQSRNQRMNSDLQGLTQKLNSNESEHLEDQLQKEQAMIELQKFEQLHKALGQSLGATESEIDDAFKQSTFDINQNENEQSSQQVRTESRMQAEVSVLKERHGQRRKVVIDRNQYQSQTLDEEQISKSPHRLQNALKFEEAIARQKLVDSKLSSANSKLRKMQIPKITPMMLPEQEIQPQSKLQKKLKRKLRSRAQNKSQLPETKPFWPNPNNLPQPNYQRMNKESTINIMKNHNKNIGSSQGRNQSQDCYNEYEDLDQSLYSEEEKELYVNSQKILVTDENHSPGIVTVLKVNPNHQDELQQIQNLEQVYHSQHVDIPDYSNISANFSAAQFEQKIMKGTNLQSMAQKRIQSQEDQSLDGTIHTLEDAANSMSELSETPYQRSLPISQQQTRVQNQNHNTSPPATKQVQRSKGPSFVVSGKQMKKSPRDSRHFQQIQAKQKLQGLQHLMDAQLPPISQQEPESQKVSFAGTTMAFGKKDTNELSSRPSLKPKLQNQDIQHINPSQLSQPTENQNDTPHLRDISLAVTDRGLDITIERSGSQNV